MAVMYSLASFTEESWVWKRCLAQWLRQLGAHGRRIRGIGNTSRWACASRLSSHATGKELLREGGERVTGTQTRERRALVARSLCGEVWEAAAPARSCLPSSERP